MSGANKPQIATLGALKKSGYKSSTIKEELRQNLVKRIKSRKPMFEGIQGYEDTVLPQLQAAVLSKHNMIFLGLRGQAKTKMARLLTELLDDWVPFVIGADLHDDPLMPLSRVAKDILEEKGDETPIDWWHKSERYSEKLATPDVSVADLIGDVDPIKAATMKLDYSDERVIHYGMIPRANRSVFVINELPDLQPRIQVALFNMLQEGDVQIRGFNLRLPLDVQFVFTANPEDYTNRGSIVTPLKDRIESQILTHYPKTIALSRLITDQESRISDEQREAVQVPDLLKNLIERIAFEARESEYVDQKSGVSARLTISAMESLYSVAERRMLINGEKNTIARISDLLGVIPAITGKIELVYEGELEGISNVAIYLIGKAIRSEFENYFPSPEKLKKIKNAEQIYAPVVNWFNEGQEVDILQNDSLKDYAATLNRVPGLGHVIDKSQARTPKDEKFLMMEFLLHGLSEFSMLSKHKIDQGAQFKDIMSGMIDMDMDFEEEDVV